MLAAPCAHVFVQLVSVMRTWAPGLCVRARLARPCVEGWFQPFSIGGGRHRMARGVRLFFWASGIIFLVGDLVLRASYWDRGILPSPDDPFAQVLHRGNEETCSV